MGTRVPRSEVTHKPNYCSSGASELLLQTAAEAFSAEHNFPTLNCLLPVPGCQGFAQLKLHGPFPRILLLPQRSIPAVCHRAPRAAFCRRVLRRDPRSPAVSPPNPTSCTSRRALAEAGVASSFRRTSLPTARSARVGPSVLYTGPRHPSVLFPRLFSPRSPGRPRPRNALPAGGCRSLAAGPGPVTSRWSCGPRPLRCGRRRQRARRARHESARTRPRSVAGRMVPGRSAAAAEGPGRARYGARRRAEPGADPGGGCRRAGMPAWYGRWPRCEPPRTPCSMSPTSARRRLPSGDLGPPGSGTGSVTPQVPPNRGVFCATDAAVSAPDASFVTPRHAPPRVEHRRVPRAAEEGSCRPNPRGPLPRCIPAAPVRRPGRSGGSGARTPRSRCVRRVPRSASVPAAQHRDPKRATPPPYRSSLPSSPGSRAPVRFGPSGCQGEAKLGASESREGPEPRGLNREPPLTFKKLKMSGACIS